MTELQNNSSPAHVVETVTVLDGQQLSDSLDMTGLTLLGIIIPAGITSASLSFEVSFDNSGIFSPYVNAVGTLVTISNLSASNAVGLAAVDFVPIRKIRIKTVQNEVGNKQFKLNLRRIA